MKTVDIRTIALSDELFPSYRTYHSTRISNLPEMSQAARVLNGMPSLNKSNLALVEVHPCQATQSYTCENLNGHDTTRVQIIGHGLTRDTVTRHGRVITC